MKDLQTLKSLEKDALREVANLGACHAATAISKLIQATVQISVSQISILKTSELPATLGAPEAVVAAIYFRIYGEAPAKLLLCLPEASVPPVLEMLGVLPAPGCGLDEMQRSALKELGNILCGAYLNALARFLDMQLFPSVPALAIDMISALLSTVLAETAEHQRQALLIETQFCTERKSLSIHLFLIPEEDSLQTMLAALGATTGVDPSA